MLYGDLLLVKIEEKRDDRSTFDVKPTFIDLCTSEHKTGEGNRILTSCSRPHGKPDIRKDGTHRAEGEKLAAKPLLRGKFQDRLMFFG